MASARCGRRARLSRVVGTLVLSFVAPGGARAAGNAPTWAAETASPAPIAATEWSDLERAVLAKCGPGERGLRDTAAGIVSVKHRGGAIPDFAAIAFAQRAAGEPHPWARAWAASGRALAVAPTLREIDAWLGADHFVLRRCGVARGVAADGRQVLVVVAVDALADLSPLPTRTRVGQWLDVEARMRVPVRGGKVVVLGPSGVPRSLLTSFAGDRLRARFAPDEPGEFAVQVVADVAWGPRPVLEARVFADVEPPSAPSDDPAPGERPSGSAGDEAVALEAMLTAARASVQLPPLVRDARLDHVARSHAEVMARSQALAHDAGDGDPMERMHEAGLDPRESAENVARASNLALAQRAMWASPSHRLEMMRRDVDHVGLGVAKDEQGDTWVVELFAASP